MTSRVRSLGGGLVAALASSAALLLSSPAVARPGESSMYYADLAAWAQFRYEMSLSASPEGATEPKPTENFIQRDFAAAKSRFDAAWGALPQTPLASGPALSSGSTGPRVASLRTRLGLPADGGFDAALAERISAFRRAHDLPAGVSADDAVIAALNRGHAYYSGIIEQNLRRAAELPVMPGKRFVLVDTAEQRLYLYEGERQVDTMKVIVGKASDKTPLMAGFISYAEINPYWNVPEDLVRDRYAARIIAGGRNYLDTRGFTVMEGHDENERVVPYSEIDWRAVQAGRRAVWLRQDPGPGNGMGRVKFMFPNRFGVYLHDTPSVALFDQDTRLESAGCVRVERPWDLARWLYGREMGWQGRPNNQRVDLPEPVPVYLAYFTAMPKPEGFDFRQDVYAKDRAGI